MMDIRTSKSNIYISAPDEPGYVAQHNTILRAVVGSTTHGLHIEGTDDRDEMGVFIEPPEYVMGLRTIEQWTYRTKPEGVRSGVGDLDLTIYSLKKFCSLAAKGNPSILILLHVPSEATTVKTQLGADLQFISDKFASKNAVRKFIGYMTAQKERLFGERGQMRVKRPELIDKYGYDTKYAMHAIRLGFQGIEFANTGKLTLPMAQESRSVCRSIREGKYALDFIRSFYENLQDELEVALEKSPLPQDADWYGINNFMMGAYTKYWDNNPRLKQILK